MWPTLCQANTVDGQKMPVTFLQKHFVNHALWTKQITIAQMRSKHASFSLVRLCAV